jgi:hypothetical protein
VLQERVLVLGGVDRLAVGVLELLRLKNTVPRKMATVTHRTPRLPQKTPLQPVLKTGAESNNVLRSADINLRWDLPPGGF